MTTDPEARPRTNVGRTLNRAALAIALMGLVNAAIVLWFLDRTEAHGTTIALVERQRTWARSLAELTSAEDQRAAAREVDATMELLRHGGIDRGVRVPPAPRAVAGQIDRIETDWEALTIELGDGASPERVRELTARIASDADAVVAALRARRRTYRRGLALLAGATSLFFLTVSLMGARFIRTMVEKPARGLQALARRALERKPPPELDLPPEHGFKGAIEAVTDLSQRLEQVRSERDEAQADYRAIFDNSLAGIYQIGADGRVSLANAALADLLGYDSARELEDVITDAHRELFVAADHREQVGRSRGEGIFETKMRRRDGSEVWVLESTRLSGERGDLSCEGVVFDITPRKNAFDALRRLTGRVMELQDDERRRLARELHDSMGQLLAAMKMNLTRLGDTAALEPEAAELLRDSLELGEEASRQTRTMSHLLHPPLLEELGLEHAIRDFAAGYQKRSGIAVEVDVKAPDRLPSSLETCMFRFVQECLTNIHRHSGSESAIIRLFKRDDNLLVRCEDRGRGMPADVWSGDGELESLGVGLRGLQARLDQLGGRLEIESSSEGTVVTAVVPLDSRAKQTGRRPR